MAERTAIAWCDHTRNFWEGCTKVSPGCDSCYAEARDLRFNRGKHWGPGAPRVPHLEAAARDLRKWNRQAAAAGVRRRVFVNSLSDFFDNEVPQDWRDVGFATMAQCTDLDFLLLTKRIGNAAVMGFEAMPNVWLGATVVNQEEVERDVPKLLAVDAAVHFVSYEPALDEIYIENRLRVHPKIPGIDWVIVGGESGKTARLFPISWVRQILEQCKDTMARVFVKQLGSNPLIAIHDGFTPEALRAGAGTKWDKPELWPEWLRIQEFPR